MGEACMWEEKSSPWEQKVNVKFHEIKVMRNKRLPVRECLLIRTVKYAKCNAGNFTYL